jgi:hypothetical protein
MTTITVRRVVLCGLIGSTVLTSAAWGRKPEDVYAGHILLSDKPYPANARSAEAYIDAVKKQSKDRFDEDRSSKEWRIFMAAFFKAAPGDLEVTIKIFDVTKGQRLVDTFEQYLSSGKERAYLSDLRLRHGDGATGYDPNSKLHIQVEARGKVLSAADFYIVGDRPKYNGKVDFSKDDEKEDGDTLK